ncbi:extracellular solute-binding protein [Halomonas alkaliantarctica]|nr:extracellular solute-binding protein [Halomonas alkaliantarctica]
MTLLIAALPARAETLLFPAVEEAERQRELTIHAALDLPQARPLLEDFHRRYPDITLTYRNLSTLALNRSFLHDPSAADVIISSAMPWQFSLVNDGHARALGQAAVESWPEWARWRDELVAFTFEPIVMVYHRDLAEIASPPRNHAELVELLDRHQTALKGRVATYDPVRSGAGYSYAIEEAQLSPRYWDLVVSLGGVNAALHETSSEMLNGVASGRFLLGYNVLGSYAKALVDEDPNLEMVIPDDYALVIQRSVFIPEQAPHPVAAGQFVNYLMSQEGQEVLARQTTLGAIHPQVSGEGSGRALRETFDEAIRPIGLSPRLLTALDALKRRAFLARWQREFERGQE